MAGTTFKIPGEIVYGPDSLQRLATLDGRRAMLVTGGSSMKRFGFLDQATEILEQAGFTVTCFDGVEPNPSVQTVRAGAAAMDEFKPDWIVAIGGGSALDAAKIMWAFHEHPDLTFEDIVPVCSLPALRRKARFCAIPSTSGTASEITAFSVITDTEQHIKYPIVSPHIVPDLAIIDPALPRCMPPHVTAHTGMDVMAHAVETYASIAATSFTDPLAAEAVRLVLDNLVQAHANGDDMQARDAMHNASALAGMAFSNASLGLVHSLAHKIGGEFGVTHGLANAILMPVIIRFNRQFTDKYTQLERQLGIDDIAVAVERLNAQLGIPATFREITEVEIGEAAFLEVLERMSINAHADPCTLTNPGQPTVDDVKAIYEKSFFGTRGRGSVAA